MRSGGFIGGGKPAPYFFPALSASKVTSSRVNKTSTHSVASGESGTMCQIVGGAEGEQAAASTCDVILVQTGAVMLTLLGGVLCSL